MIDITTYSLCKKTIKDSIDKIDNFSFKVVSTLPATGEKIFIYLVQKKKLSTLDTKNSYDEYIWVDGKWEHLGTTDIELDQYLKKEDYKQSDWNQNDETQPDYVKNRICYEGKIYIVNGVLGGFSQSDGIYQSEIQTEKLLKLGDSYSVSFDGVESVSEVRNIEAIGLLYLGNASILIPAFPNTGEQYVIASTSSGVWDIATKVPGENHKVRLSYDGVQMIPKKFIPFSGVGRSNLFNGEIFNDYVNNSASDSYAHAEGKSTTASSYASHAEGNFTTASGLAAHVEGYDTTASSNHQHAQGKYNIDDPSNKYAHIVGNGIDKTTRSNAHTLDWDGNSWYQGSVLVAGTDMDAPDAELNPDSVIIKSSTPGSTKRFKITVTDDGVIKATIV